MFNNPRYTTRGVTEKIPIELQIFMWSAIDTMEVKRKDYLQVFKLYAENVDGRSVQIVDAGTAQLQEKVQVKCCRPNMRESVRYR